MAKQKGLHQIKGKVGDMSYYQTSGVPGGLIRRIPEGLSSRVKTADEYANTRLNNDEFKNASSIATFAFNAVPYRKTSMIRRFAVAAMIKEALQFIKDGSGNWGQRIPSVTFDNILVDLLENHAKLGPYSGEFGDFSFEVIAGGTYQVKLLGNNVVAANLASLGIDGFYTMSVRGAMAEVVDAEGFARQHFGVSSIVVDDVIDLTDIDTNVTSFIPSPQTVGLSQAGYTVAQGAANNGMFCICTLVPYRQISSQRHNLYEYATFAAIPLGAIPGA